MQAGHAAVLVFLFAADAADQLREPGFALGAELADVGFAEVFRRPVCLDGDVAGEKFIVVCR